MKELNELKKRIDRTTSFEDVSKLFGILVEIIKALKDAFQKDLKEFKENLDSEVSMVLKSPYEIEKIKSGFESKIRTLETKIIEIINELYQLAPSIKKDYSIKISSEVKKINSELERINNRVSLIKSYDDTELRQKIEKIKIPPVLTGREIIDEINSETDSQIDIKQIEGLEEILKEIKKMASINNTRTIFGNNRIQVFGNDSKVGAKSNEINFGSGLTVTDQNGRILVQATGGGGGFTIETPTGSVNSSNTTFTVTEEPEYVIADGITYFEGAGYTYSSLSIEMVTPPTQYIRSFY